MGKKTLKATSLNELIQYSKKDGKNQSFDNIEITTLFKQIPEGLTINIGLVLEEIFYEEDLTQEDEPDFIKNWGVPLWKNAYKKAGWEKADEKAEKDEQGNDEDKVQVKCPWKNCGMPIWSKDVIDIYFFQCRYLVYSEFEHKDHCLIGKNGDKKDEETENPLRIVPNDGSVDFFNKQGPKGPLTKYKTIQVFCYNYE